MRVAWGVGVCLADDVTVNCDVAVKCDGIGRKCSDVTVNSDDVIAAKCNDIAV